jgi:membrane protein DedA with SNARE-associated domain
MIQDLIVTYGYLAVFVGTFLEGETLLLLAGFAAAEGYLNLPWVVVIAFAGAFSGDQFYYWLGRRYGRRLLERMPTRYWRRAMRVAGLLEKAQNSVMLGFRFVYGIRILTPVVISMTSISPRKFMIFNALGAAIWAIVIACGGYLFGAALELFLGNLKRFEYYIFALLLVVGFCAWLFNVLRCRRRDRLAALSAAAEAQVVKTVSKPEA